jgi:hypothetical protein
MNSVRIYHPASEGSPSSSLLDPPFVAGPAWRAETTGFCSFRQFAGDHFCVEALVGAIVGALASRPAFVATAEAAS